jgi:hypothetical protein
VYAPNGFGTLVTSPLWFSDFATVPQQHIDVNNAGIVQAIPPLPTPRSFHPFN